MKIYFVRHGESKANVLHEISNRGFKHGLTERGFEQAEQLSQDLRKVAFKKIFTSPLKRAYQTAEIIKKHQVCPLEISDALREFDCGEIEGKSDPASWETLRWVFNQWLEGNWSARIPGGESHLDIQARFIPFIEALTQSVDDQNYLLVGHGGTYLSMLPLILDNIDFDFVRQNHIDHTSPIIAEVDANRKTCSQWGNIKHFEL